MKKITSLFALMLLVLVSCSDDDNQITYVNPPAAGTMTVNGVTTNISNGFIIKPYTGTDPDYDSRRFYIVLTDGTAAIEENELTYSDNVHQLIDFNLYTAEDAPTGVQNTTYNLFIPETGFDMADAFIDHTSINTNIVFQNGEYLSGDDFVWYELFAVQFSIQKNYGF
jgi:hypothetical protein